jgi:hypothetical protein
MRALNFTAFVRGNISPCCGCGEKVKWVEHASGKVAPYTLDGLNHFRNCPEAERFRKTRRTPA